MISDSKTSDGTGTSTFTSSLTGLTGGTTYFVRAYATNSVGTGYGTEVNFTTSPAVVPTLSSTTSVSSITLTTASSGGVISNDGGASLTERGVVWGTSTGPTISGSKTSDGTEPGTFTSSLTSLTPSTTYYVRAYATNSVGTGYGTEVSFTTNAIAVGSAYQGGIVAYLFVSGNTGYVDGEIHGLIAATEDIGNSDIKWWNLSNNNSAVTTGTAIGTGLTNTNAIINVQGGTAGSYTYAAGVCADYSVTDVSGVTYDDWYLPSTDELNKLFLLKGAGSGNFANNLYWSSSNLNSLNANCQDFTSSGQGQTNHNKNNGFSVRAVRTF
jgi:hypothetical protein